MLWKNQWIDCAYFIICSYTQQQQQQQPFLNIYIMIENKND